MRKANELMRVARDIRNIADNKFESCLENIEKGWRGDSANAYFNKCNILLYKMNLTAKSLEESAETIKKIALRTYRSEMQSLEIANKRSYR